MNERRFMCPLTSNIKISLIISTIAVSFALRGVSQTPPPPGGITTTNETNVEHRSAAFLREAAKDNDAELAFADLGARQAQNSELKSYCVMLRKDHVQANKDVQTLAQKYG